MKKIKDLYFQYKEIINYLIIGGLTTIVSLSIYYLLVLTVLNPENALELQFANVISWVFAVIFAYYTNRKYVFESKNKSSKEMIKFFLSRVTTLIIDMVLMYLLVSLLHFNDKIIKIIVQIIIIILNYLLSKFIVFKGDDYV